jgi:hypothetical protein
MRKSHQLERGEGSMIQSVPPVFIGPTRYFQYLNTNDWHAGTGGDGVTDRLGLFIAFVSYENDRVAVDPATTTTGSAVVSTDFPEFDNEDIAATAGDLVTHECSSPTPYVVEFARAVPARADYDLPTGLHMRASR